MAVDLNKILSRQDYVKMTKSLRERCDAVEDAISSKMVNIEVSGKSKGIVVNGMRIFCICGYLFIRTPENEKESGPYRVYRSINSEKNDMASWDDDDNNRYFTRIPCSNKHALEFLNNAAAIIEELGKIEQKKVEAIKEAIGKTENI